MTKCLIAEYADAEAARTGLEVLETDDFTLENVSVVSHPGDATAQQLNDLHEESGGDSTTASAPEGRATSLGMLIGGTAAAPIAAGTMVGPFIVAGPLLGMAVGAAIGGLLGMEQWGVSQDVRADYEARVKAGSVLIIVHDVDDIRLNDAKALLQTTGPKSLERFKIEIEIEPEAQ